MPERDGARPRELDVYLLRHTPVAVPESTCYGSTDVALAEGWRESLSASLEKLPARMLDAAQIHSSPAQRCARLAQSIGRPYAVDARLREFDFGGWEMRPWANLPRAEIDAWAADVETWCVPGGECLGDVDRRASDFLASLDGGATTLVVSHGGVIRCMLARALAMPLDEIFRIKVDYGSVSRVTFSGARVRVEYFNR